MGKVKYDIEKAKKYFKLNNYLLIEKEYRNTKTKMLAQTEEGFKFEMSLENLLNNNKANPFSNKCKYLKDNLKRLISNKTPNNELIDTEFDKTIKVIVKCKKHNIVYATRVGDIKRGKECIKCGREKTTNKQKINKYLINDIIKENYLELIGEYTNNITKTLFQCKKCGHKWLVSWNNLQKYKACPKCNGSKGEKSIINFLEKNNIEFIFQKRFDKCRKIRPLPFDFYLPKFNMIIEYDGEFHYEYARFYDESKARTKLKEQQENDKIKNKFCFDNKIILLRIPYWKFNDIENILKKELQI